MNRRSDRGEVLWGGIRWSSCCREERSRATSTDYLRAKDADLLSWSTTAANTFWEAMRFVPLAFRAGSRSKDRVHIFWQKRIRTGDEMTPWWFPSHTGGGAIREDRIVLPIPPGVQWWEAMPRLLPTAEGGMSNVDRRVSNAKRGSGSPNQHSTVDARHSTLTGLRFCGAANAETKRPKRPRAQVTPEQSAKARELRDRFLESANEGRLMLAAPRAKYDVSRLTTTSIASAPALPDAPIPLLAA